MSVANSIAYELVQAPVVVVSMLSQDVAWLSLWYTAPINTTRHSTNVTLKTEHYLFCVDFGDYRIISWRELFVYVI